MKMTERTYYLPKTFVAKYAMNRIVRKYDCVVLSVKPIMLDQMLAFSISLPDNNISKVETALKNFGVM